MTNGRACRVCGVVLPERVGVCPSCGKRSGLGPSRRWMGPTAVVLVLVLIPTTIALTRPPRVNPALAKLVDAYAGISRLRADQKGTDVTAFLDNKGTLPVDVTLRLRAVDLMGKVSHEVISGPHRRIAPGATKSIEVSILTTPVAKWELDIVDLAPSPR